MTVRTPSCLGLLLRKNERTRHYIQRHLEILRSIEPDACISEDDYLVAVTVAMNPNDLQSTIDNLDTSGAVYGEDFVATASRDGVLGDLPAWLSEKTLHEGPYKQLTKFYSLRTIGGL
jgi:hypothetical protein